MAILLAHLKGKETEAQGIQARGLGDGLEVAYFFSITTREQGPQLPCPEAGLDQGHVPWVSVQRVFGGSKARWVDEVWGPEIEHGLNDFKARPGVSVPSPSLPAVRP